MADVMKYPLISIVVPCREIDALTRECVTRCLRLDYPDFEVLILPDREVPLPFSDPRMRIIPTGTERPTEKRNLGIDRSRGELCAFIDSDAYPRRDWLKSVVGFFQNPEVAAVGGPGITPPEDDFMQKASGEILSSLLGSWGARIRYRSVGGVREIDDWPTFNLICRKDILEKVNRFSVDFWPGEDTKLCIDIIETGHKILYGPGVVVYHHRRPLFIPHLRQISRYGLHRGYFSKVFPKTSRRPLYFLPSVFMVISIVGAIAFVFFPAWRPAFLGPLIAYLLAVLFTALRVRNPKMAMVTFFGMVLTHLTYGLAFLRGLATRRLTC